MWLNKTDNAPNGMRNKDSSRPRSMQAQRRMTATIVVLFASMRRETWFCCRVRTCVYVRSVRHSWTNVRFAIPRSHKLSSCFFRETMTAAPIANYTGGVEIEGKLYYGLDAEIALKQQAKFDYDLERRLREWIEETLGEKLSDDDLGNALKSGIVLCNLINKIKPGSIKKINRPKGKKAAALMEMGLCLLLLLHCALSHGVFFFRKYQTIFERLLAIGIARIVSFYVDRLVQSSRFDRGIAQSGSFGSIHSNIA